MLLRVSSPGSELEKIFTKKYKYRRVYLGLEFEGTVLNGREDKAA